MQVVVLKSKEISPFVFVRMRTCLQLDYCPVYKNDKKKFISEQVLSLYS